ncbi:MAG TPA: DUF448 domain-containing protein [Clostridiales bacterium]|nr:DUF448 domain-containing protein [Clostridiales bacterium]
MPKKIPQRMCVACRTMKPKRELIRLVASQDGEIALDPTGKKPGRGAYVCRNRHCLGQSIRGRKLDKGLKTRVSEEMIQLLIHQMEALPPDDPNEEEPGIPTGN